MTDTGKIKPAVNARGLFLPWSLVAALLLSGLIPLWVLSVKAWYVASQVEAIAESDKRQDGEIVDLRERISKQEAKP